MNKIVIDFIDKRLEEVKVVNGMEVYNFLLEQGYSDMEAKSCTFTMRYILEMKNNVANSLN